MLLITAVLVLPILSSCIWTDEPLSKKKAKDNAVIGDWIESGESVNPMNIVISTDKDGWYKLVEVEKREGKETRTTAHLVYPTISGSNHYANMQYMTPKKDVKDPKYPADYTERFMIFKYAIDGEKMKVEPLNHQKFAEEIKAKHLPGTAGETTWGNNVGIQQKPAELLKLLDDPKNEDYFGQSITFKRKAQKK